MDGKWGLPLKVEYFLKYMNSKEIKQFETLVDRIIIVLVMVLFFFLWI